MKAHTIVTILLLTAIFSPIGGQFIPEQISDFVGLEETEQNEPLFKQFVPTEELKENIRPSANAGARAVCPVVQNDGGTTGDSGNTSNTSKPLGSDPTKSISGCVDTADNSDWYSFSMSSNKDIDVELTVPSGSDFDLYLVISNSTGNYAVDASEFNDPLEKVSSVGTSISGVAGTYYIAIYQYSGDGAYNLETWTNMSKNCDNWWNPSQNDGGTGGDAVANWTDNPTNMGSNVTSAYTGCVDGTDRNDVFAFDVPANHTIEVELTMHDSAADLDIFIHAPNGSVADSGFSISNPETASTSSTTWDGVNGTYFVNVSQWSGVSNYTLKVWTNFSVPAANLVIDSTSVPSAANHGDTITIDVTVNNTGTLDTAEVFSLKIWLSVDWGESWVDHQIANHSINGAIVNMSQVISVNAQIPYDLIGGKYRIFFELDSENVVDEKSEVDNTDMAANQITIGTIITSCPSSQDDGGSGGDAGANSPGAINLGTDIEQEFRGCLDSNDMTDWYKISVSANMPLNATLVSAPEGDFNLDLLTSSGEQIASSSSWWFDEFVSTEDSVWNLTAGTYTLIVNRSSGDGDYRLFIGQPAQGTWVPPFTCGGASDLSLGQDASDESSNPSNIGTNPNEQGIGCVDGSDVADAFQFTLSSYNNVEISLIQTEGTSFTASLYTQMGSLIDGWESPGVDEMTWKSIDNTAHEGQDGTYVLLIGSNGTVGNYSLSIVTTNPAPADLVADSLSCPSNLTSGEQGFVSYSMSNLRGPSAQFDWNISLVNQDTQETVTLLTESVTDGATYGNVIASASDVVSIGQTTATGMYNCILTVDTNNVIPESNESNNIIFGNAFFIQNYDELWANDIDQDGYNTTDTGDGIIDECPTTYGESTDPMFGCPDLDGDGWANSIDFDPQDASQWVDSDNDTFGDNSTGTDGDQCPDVAGVIDGDDGIGCPKAPIDADGDGVEDNADQCPNTPAGTTVDATGCEVITVGDADGDGVDDDSDNCANTPTGTTVDENGCAVDDTNTGGGLEINEEDGGDGGDGGDGTDVDGSGDGNDGTDNTSTDVFERLLQDTNVMIGAGVAILIIVLLTFFLIGRKGNGDLKEDAFVNAAFSDAAFGGGGTVMPGGVLPYDASMTAEQLQYEQQLVAQGHPAETARQYGNQYFRQG